MSTNPFVLARAAYDITSRGAPPMRSRARPPAPLSLTILLIAMTTACAPSRPIPPSPAYTSDATARSDFDAAQRARLADLRAALAEPAPPGLSRGLLVRLAFDDAADLDLFVTDPVHESVYFANSPTRSGGSLIDDRRCDDPSPRVEAVHYPSPTAGRYRVGVDFHRRCPESPLSNEEGKQGLYVVRVDQGGRVLERMGMATPGHFEVIVIEFDVE